MRWPARRAAFVALSSLAFALVGWAAQHHRPTDRAEITFFVDGSKVVGEIGRFELDRLLYTFFADHELASIFGETLVAAAAERPESRRWLEDLLRRAGSRKDLEDPAVLRSELRHYLTTVVKTQVGRRVAGSPARTRADYLLYAADESDLRLHVGFHALETLPWLGEATAEAFNRAARRVNEGWAGDWQEEVTSYEDLLASRVAFLSERVQGYEEVISASRDRILSSIGEAEPSVAFTELAAWLRSTGDHGAASYLPWLARLTAEGRHAEEVRGALAGMQNARRMQELLLGTDWLDAEAFGPKSRQEIGEVGRLRFAPVIPPEEAVYSSERVIEPAGLVMSPTWASAAGGAFLGLGLALATLAALASWPARRALGRER